MSVPIYFNGRFLTQEVTGVQRYALETLRALDELIDAGEIDARAWRLTVLVPPELEDAPRFRHVRVERVGTLAGRAWEQLELPRRAGEQLLVSLCNSGPLLARNHVVTLHDAAVFDVPETFSRRFRVAFGCLLAGLAATARRILTVSRFSRARLERACGVAPWKLRVTHEGADHMDAIAADASVLARHGLTRPFVLLVGSLNARKNLAVAAEAIERLGGAFDVVIVGSAQPRVFGPSAHALPAGVRLLGAVGDGELKALYQHAACFLYPSLYEGFGLPPLEAMTCGCPVIASHAASMPEVCGDAALYFNPRSGRELAERIETVMGAPDLRARLREAGLRRAAQFTWSRCARETFAVLREVACGGSINPGGRA